MQGWQRVWKLLLGWGHAQGVTARQDQGDGSGRFSGSVTQSIFPILAISSSQILVSSSISWFYDNTIKDAEVHIMHLDILSYSTKNSIKRQKICCILCHCELKVSSGISMQEDKDVCYLLLQSLFQRVILHLLLPQTGGQRYVLWARLCTHLSDLLIGPVRYREQVKSKGIFKVKVSSLLKLTWQEN